MRRIINNKKVKNVNNKFVNKNNILIKTITKFYC